MPRKQVKPALKSWSEVDECLGRCCDIEARKRKMEAKMNAELTEIRERYQPLLDRFAKDQGETEALIAQFCEVHSDEFKTKKSRELTHGTVSFRTSPPSCRLASRKWKWESVVKALKNSVNAALRKCVRTKESVNKDAVLAAVAGKKASESELKEHGLKIKSKDTFGIELKYEESPEIEEAAT